jgi:hypothetical protein
VTVLLDDDVLGHGPLRSRMRFAGGEIKGPPLAE